MSSNKLHFQPPPKIKIEQSSNLPPCLLLLLLLLSSSEHPTREVFFSAVSHGTASAQAVGCWCVACGTAQNLRPAAAPPRFKLLIRGKSDFAPQRFTRSSTEAELVSVHTLFRHIRHECPFAFFVESSSNNVLSFSRT